VTSPQLPAGSSLISAAAVHPPSLAYARRKIFTQREFNSCWVMFFIDRRCSTRRCSGVLAYLRVCSSGPADYFVYSSPSLACKCESEDVHPMQGIRLLHGAYFEDERDITCHYCRMFVPWDVCSTRHPDLCFDAASLAGWRLFSSCRAQTSACSFFVSWRDRTSCVSGSYTLTG